MFNQNIHLFVLLQYGHQNKRLNLIFFNSLKMLHTKNVFKFVYQTRANE